MVAHVSKEKEKTDLHFTLPINNPSDKTYLGRSSGIDISLIFHK